MGAHTLRKFRKECGNGPAVAIRSCIETSTLCDFENTGSRRAPFSEGDRRQVITIVNESSVFPECITVNIQVQSQNEITVIEEAMCKLDSILGVLKVEGF